MKVIQKQNFPNERDLYGAQDVALIDCSFDGAEDGESALKEAKNVSLTNCFMNLRYPLWHDKGVKLDGVKMTELCRAALWYTEKLEAEHCDMFGIKALRECKDAHIRSSRISSPEFGWRCKGVTIEDSEIESEYLFFESKDVTLRRVQFTGKYSFQYVKNLVIEDSELSTKDAFWHAKNVTVRNSVVRGEYLGWYSENVTFINCKIIGTQPLCYCKNLQLINCTTEGCDLAFEYSDVKADLHGEVMSVKNPRSGEIVADWYGDVLLTEDSKYPCKCRIVKR
ncbi:MAG: DUF3737 family protein [Clostridia bacterium]|nr:DUF3737 family protein [Clostridia bacterium]